MNTSSSVEKIKLLKEEVYKPPNAGLCHEHNLSKLFFCAVDECQFKGIPICKECNHGHILLNINKIVPLTSQWIVKEWQQIEQQNRQIFNQWRNTEINLKYCIDILNQILKQVLEKHHEGSQLLQLPILQDITNKTCSLFNLKSSQSVVKEFLKLNSDYHLLGKQEGQKIRCKQQQKQRKARLLKNEMIAKKSKDFSQSALLFSQQLARTIQDKLKRQKILKKVKKIERDKILCLSDLRNEKDLEKVGEVLIEIHKKNKGEEDNIETFLSGCKNIKCLHINNQNGNILQFTWDRITNHLEFLKHLTELKLNLKSDDLKYLIHLFKTKSNAVRHISKLYLKITDQPQLNLSQVANLCNSLQLNTLFLTLTRDSIDKEKITSFFHQLRVYTSLSQLPLSQLSINITKNHITHSQDIIKVTQIFNKKCLEIKKKTIQI